jgi:tRNA modification GTPase
MIVDPIVAIATAPGRGGVGVIRISLPNASLKQPEQLSDFLIALFNKAPVPRKASVVGLRNSAREIIDEGLLLYFDAPKSYTGEHVIEFQGHGGPAVLKACLDEILKAGAHLNLRHAQPGEFTQRAFLNDKLDLAQAEAVADLIDAGTVKAAKAAMASLKGVFSSLVNQLADELIHLRLLVEATLDFPEEEIDFLEKAGARQALQQCLATTKKLLQEGRDSLKLSQGLTVVLAGKPNVGKSSLLNALAGEERVIVTPVAGTTRDSIHHSLVFDGIPLRLVDTAGLRETTDIVEQIGIQRTRYEIEHADIVLHLLDDVRDLESAALPLDIGCDGPVVKVLNKIDLPENQGSAAASSGSNTPVVRISALKGLGLESLKNTVLNLSGLNPNHDFSFLARERHLVALAVCLSHLELAGLHAAQTDKVLDLFAEELRLAHDALGEITGRVLPDDLLGLIFSRFCIGK